MKRVKKTKTLKGSGMTMDDFKTLRSITPVPGIMPIRKRVGRAITEVKGSGKLGGPAKPMQICTKSFPPKCYEMKGEGVITDALAVTYNTLKNEAKKAYNWVSDKFLPKTLPAAFKTKLMRYGDHTITTITIGRDPVNSVIQRVLNVLTLGKYESMKRKLYYDDVFHLYAIITATKDGKNIRLRLEKNNVVVLKETSDQPIEYVRIPIGSQKITLNQFIDKTIKRMSEVEYVRYDAVKNNCQRFVSEHLRANGLMNAEADKFINQDVKQLLSDPAYGFSKVITDLGNVFGHMTGGKKSKKKRTVKASPLNKAVQKGGCGGMPCKAQCGTGKIRF